MNAISGVEGIAKRLSYLCRFDGLTKHFYSEAQHSINLVKYMEKTGVSDTETLLAALMSNVFSSAAFPVKTLLL